MPNLAVAMPFISSDPHAWMRTYYEAVAAREGFSHLALSHQFELFVEAIAKDYPAKSPLMRAWNAATQRATLAVLKNVVYSAPAAQEVELWRVAKDGCQLRCIAVYMPTGIEPPADGRGGLQTDAAAEGRPCVGGTR